MAVSVKHNTLTTESPTGAGGTVGATEWNEAHEVQMAADRLLGRTTAGTGAVEEISIGTGLSMAAGVLSASGGGGDAYIRRPKLIMAGGSSSLAVSGIGATTTVSTSGSGATYAPGGFSQGGTQYTSAATTGSLAGAYMTTGYYGPPTSTLPNPAIGLSGTLIFPDASYGSGATGARLGFGVARGAPSAMGGDNGTSGDNDSQGIWFSYSTNRGANWYIVIYSTASGSVVNAIDTGVAFSPGQWNFGLDFLESSTGFDWRIRQTGSTATKGTITSTSFPFPVSRTADTYYLFGMLATLTTTARKLVINRMGLDHLEPV